jgi:hypothetical protein
MPHRTLRTVLIVVAPLLITAVIVVPTIMRARQHVELRDSTRLSIRLNWQADALPQKKFLVAQSPIRSHAGAFVVTLQPETTAIASRALAVDAPAPPTVFDNAPDLFRGPPSRSI